MTRRDGLRAAAARAIGARIRDARKAAGFKSQDAFAAALGMNDRRQVSRWETGANVPEEAYREKLAELTGLREEEMRRVGGEDDRELAALLGVVERQLTELLPRLDEVEREQAALRGLYAQLEDRLPRARGNR